METLDNIFVEPLLRINYDDLVKKAVADHAVEIEDLNTEQLNRGLDSNGNDLGEYRNFAYKNRFRPVDLRLTGAFHKSIKAKPFKKEFRMIATDPKTDELQDKYGDDILGVSPADVSEAAEIIKPTVVDQFRKKVLSN